MSKAVRLCSSYWLEAFRCSSALRCLTIPAAGSYDVSVHVTVQRYNCAKVPHLKLQMCPPELQNEPIKAADEPFGTAPHEVKDSMSLTVNPQDDQSAAGS